jgi:multiple sugar transport system permease protein
LTTLGAREDLRVLANSPARRRRAGDLGPAFFFLGPALLGFVVFHLIPTVRGFYASFTEWSLLDEPQFIGLENYRTMLSDQVFWNALRVTAEYVVINIGVQTLVAIGIAVLMDRLTKSVLVRSVVLAPWLMSNVVAAMLFLWILDYNLGIGNAMLDAIGLGRIAFLGAKEWVIPSIALINVWRHMGYTALLIFAGIQTIPRDVIEASAVDGCGEWRTFWHTTLPLLRPVMALVLVVTVIGSFQIFDTVDITTEGGPVHASRVIYLYIFDRAFTRFDFGYASALSVALFLILLTVTLLQLRMMRAGQSDLA